MFGKKKCKSCENKVSNKYEFCPYCGDSFSDSYEKEEDSGMLGKDDSPNEFENEFEQFSRALFGGMGGKVLNRMLGSAMKMLEKEMQREMQRGKMKEVQNFHPKTNFQLFINGKRINTDGSKNFENLNQGSGRKKTKKSVKEIPSSHFSKEQLKKFSGLSKEEPKTNLKRVSNKVIYEINLPGVNSIGDTSIVRFENSTEIKAIGKNKAYSKVIPISFPIMNCEFSKGKIVLELDAEN